MGTCTVVPKKTLLWSLLDESVAGHLNKLSFINRSFCDRFVLGYSSSSGIENVEMTLMSFYYFAVILSMEKAWPYI